MIPIYYKSSEGVVINLIETPYRMLTETDLLNNEWVWETVGTNFPKITSLKKEIVSPPFSIRVTGQTKEEMYNNLEHLEGVFDRDCFLGEMGRLYIGDFYRECFITATTHGKVFEKTHTVVEFVATSNDGFWKNEKTFKMGGEGLPTGEIAYTASVHARPNNDSLIWSPNNDKTATLEWDSGGFGSIKRSLEFNLGSVVPVDRIRGIYIGSTTPCSTKLQTWQEGHYTGTSNTVLVDIPKDPQIPDPYYTWYSNPISTDGYEKFTLLESSLPPAESFVRLRVLIWQDEGYGYYQTLIDATRDYTGREFDVGSSQSIQFAIDTIHDPQLDWQNRSVRYKLEGRDWQTVQEYTSLPNEDLEIDYNDDLEVQYFRLYTGSGFLGEVRGDEVSIHHTADEPTVRNLLDYGYTPVNIEVIDMGNGRFNYKILNDRNSGYLYLDSTGVLLKKIKCLPRTSESGIVQIEGLDNDTWEFICTLESTSPIDLDFNDHYNQIRVKFLPTGPSPVDHYITNFYVGAEFDPMVLNESYAPSDAIIEIDGPRNNPQISIGGVEYGANIELAEGHRLQINTIEHTVRDYSSEYAFSNVYSARSEGAFEKIERGENTVYWDGQQTVRIKLFQARSTPKWN